jgi:alpha-maltose-1-phosphate synthase
LPLKCADPLERLTGLPMPIPYGSAWGTMRRAVRNSDVVIIHDALYLTSLLAMLFARIAGKRVILIQHIAAIEFASPAMRAIMRLANAVVTRPMLARADQVIFISDTVRAAFADVRMKRPPRLLFNGVDTAIFNTVPRDDGVGSLPEARKVLLFVGRFVAKKGLAVVEQLARRHPEIGFALAGTGPIDPGRWGLSNVHLLGTRTPAELADLYRAADLLLLPSVGEGYPLVIQEAMACGLPVICGEESARADPDAAQWLKGARVDLADPEASAARVAAVLDAAPLPPEEREAMAAYAAAAYSWPIMASAVGDLSGELIAAR